MGDVAKVVSNVANEVGKGVSNVTKEVGKGVENVTRETGKTLEVVGVTVANSGNLVGGDVGKGINAILGAPGGAIAATGSMVKGDYKGAATRAVGAVTATQTVGLNSSSSLKAAAEHDTVNFVTFGQSRDMAKSADIGRKFINTGESSAGDWSTLGRTTVRAGLMAGAVVGGSAALGTETGKGFMGAVGTKVGAGAGAVATGVAGTVTSQVVKDALSGGAKTSEAPQDIQPGKNGMSGGTMAALAAGVALLFGLIL